MAPPVHSPPSPISSPTAVPRLQLWRHKSQYQALGPPKRLEIQSAEINSLVKSINSKTAVELAAVSRPVGACVELGLPPWSQDNHYSRNSSSPVSEFPELAPLVRAPAIDPCSLGPGDHYREWHRKALGLESIHPHKGLHTWGPDPELPEEEVISEEILPECVPSRYATAELIAACMAATRKDRLEKAIARPIGVGAAGRGAAWARQAAKSELAQATAAEAKNYERLQMAYEDLLSSWSGEESTKEFQKLNSDRQEQLRIATAHATRLQASFRGWLARCRCAIKRREQKRLWQQFRKQKRDEKIQEMEEIEAKKAEEKRLAGPTEEMILKTKIEEICKQYSFNEDSDFQEDADVKIDIESTSSSPQKPVPSIEVADGELGSTRDDTDKLLSHPLSPSSAGGASEHMFSPVSSHHHLDNVDAALPEKRSSRFLEKAAGAASETQNQLVRSKHKVTLEETETHNKSTGHKTVIKFTKSIKFDQTEESTALLRKTFMQAREWRTEDSWTGCSDGTVVAHMVRTRYQACCERWKAKPNSLVLSKLECPKPAGLQVSYDFENAHLGDRGAVCLLHALALDKRLTSLSLRSCCLRGGSGPVIAVFIEMHPKLQDINLSNNSLSFEFGELLLDAIEHRSLAVDTTQTRNHMSATGGVVEKSRSRNSSKQPSFSAQTPSQGEAHQVGSITTNASLHDVTVNLEGTWFTWDKRHGCTVGPPCGTLWAGCHDNRSKLAPSGYEKLRNRLDETDLIKYESKDISIIDLPAVSTAKHSASNRSSRAAEASTPPRVGSHKGSYTLTRR